MSQQQANNYLNLCTEFYDLIRPHPPEDAYAFYRTYVANVGGMVLEPMCGSGRFLLPLLKEGFNVVGFDASKHMLNALNTKAASQNLSPRVWQGFTENLNTGNRYDLIFIPSGSFGHLIDLNSVKNSLQAFYGHLKKDGILLFEVETSKTVPEQLGVWRGFVCHKSNDSFIVASRLTTFANSVCYSIDKYELVEKGKIVQAEMETFDVRVYDDPLLLKNILNETGFREVKTIKAFDSTLGPDLNDSSIIYECRK